MGVWITGIGVSLRATGCRTTAVHFWDMDGVHSGCSRYLMDAAPLAVAPRYFATGGAQLRTGTGDWGLGEMGLAFSGCPAQGLYGAGFTRKLELDPATEGSSDVVHSDANQFCQPNIFNSMRSSIVEA